MKPLVPALALTGVLALTGCAAFSDDAAPGASGGKVRVVAAFYPHQYVAQRVAGTHASVENLTQPGSEPHDLEIPPKQTAEIVDADLVVYENGFQPAVDDAIAQNATGEQVDAAKVAGLEPRGHDGHDHGGEDHEIGAEHQQGDLDPHFWQDPLRLARVGDAVAKKLTAIDPGHADQYAANAAALRSDL